MSSETNVILKYRRPADCWVCSECEAENNMLLATCAVCGERKDPGARVIPAWSGDEPPKSVPPKTTPSKKPQTRTVQHETVPPIPPSEENSGETITIILIILLIIVIGAILVLVLQSGALAADVNETENCTLVQSMANMLKAL